jgi:uncharacterized protein (UPF0332 family)
VDAFQDCLNKGRLKEIEPNAEVVSSELETALDEIERARNGYENGNWNETASQSYFALFRCARAAIKSKGYKETNLYGLCAAVQKLFVDEDLLPAMIIKQIKRAKDIKDAVYNDHRVSHRDARELLKWTLIMASDVFSIVNLPGFSSDQIETTLPENKSDNYNRPARQPEPENRSRPIDFGNGYNQQRPQGGYNRDGNRGPRHRDDDRRDR